MITGASRRIGIGAALARRAVADGAGVLLHTWSPHDAEQPWGADAGGTEALLAELRAAGGRVEHVALDLAAPDAPAQLIAAAREAFGHVDALVANHARSSGQDLEHLTAAELDHSYAVNTRATLLLAQAFAAQHEVTRSLAVHLAPRRITVNCVNPGPNDTGYADAETHAAIAAANPGGRWSQPTDTAHLVAWLLSDEAAWVTGQTIASDGGWSSR